MSRTSLFIAGTLLILTAFMPVGQSDVQLTCVRVHKATNSCHFNFTIDGAPFRFVDIGCKYNKKHKEVIQKAKDGTLALAKDWKIDCGQKKVE